MAARAATKARRTGQGESRAAPAGAGAPAMEQAQPQHQSPLPYKAVRDQAGSRAETVAATPSPSAVKSDPQQEVMTSG